MKKILKIVGIIFVAIIVLSVLGSMMDSGNSSSNNTSTEKTSSTTETTAVVREDTKVGETTVEESAVEETTEEVIEETVEDTFDDESEIFYEDEEDYGQEYWEMATIVYPSTDISWYRSLCAGDFLEIHHVDVILVYSDYIICCMNTSSGQTITFKIWTTNINESFLTGDVIVVSGYYTKTDEFNQVIMGV